MLLGIDATNWIHQLWHAQGGNQVCAAAVRRAKALIDALSPSAVVACFDRCSFRHDLVTGYKAGRQEKPAELLAQLAAAEEAFGAVATIAAEDGYEADDLLATLAAWGRQSNEPVVLCSPDKDLRQCLDGPVKLLRKFAVENHRPVHGEWYLARNLLEDYGLEPAQWVDYQSLVGDRSDAIAGCPGWGDKTAAAALRMHRGVEAMAELDWITVGEKKLAALKRWVRGGQYALARQLVTLRTDCAAVWDAMR